MTSYARYQHLKVDLKDGIATLTLNRPEALNAINKLMHKELSLIFDDLNQDKRVKAIVITGAGRAFSSGGDLKWFQHILEEPGSLRDLMREARKIVDDMLNVEVPLVAAVNGPAAGLGVTLALFCDIVIASERAKFGDPHVRVGVVAGDGGAVLWPVLVGVHKAKELLMTGDIVDAREAEWIGLINRVVGDDAVVPAAMEMAKRLANGPTLAINFTKMAINKRLKQDVNLILDTSLAWEEQTFYSEDHKEAVNAFIEKRAPRFQGK
ncbi:MAG: enoyl-CoA hydratase-related protein [Dehalococcoidia bacterium]|nr:enoyl-CoA hydratase-related protein [Dehalococcoidia bacterium]